MSDPHDPQRLLRHSLRANAAFSTLSGLTFALGSGPVAAAIGLAAPQLLVGLGLGLLVFAGGLAFVASRPRIHLPTAMQIVWADLGWVVATLPVVLLGVLNTTGAVAALAVADVVGVFAVLQYLGIRRVRGGARVAAQGAAG